MVAYVAGTIYLDRGGLGAGVVMVVWSWVCRRDWTACSLMLSHLAMRYMLIPAARPAASWVVTAAEASARVCSMAW